MTGTTGFAAFRVIDGGAQASATGTVTDKGNGQYSFALSQADTNGNDIGLLFTMTGMVAVSMTLVTTACDPTAATNFGITALPAVASGSAGAILTSGTGTAQLSVTSGLVTLAGVTHTGAVIPTVTTVTNQLTAAAIATGVWQDATAGDFTVASSIGKSLYTGNVAPGAAGGHFIAGTNAATTVTTAFTTTFTGNLTGSVGSVTGAVGSVTARVTANADQVAGSATAATNLGAQLLAQASGNVNDVSATTTGFIGNSGLSVTDDAYTNQVIAFTSGTLTGVARKVADYVGATKTFTLTPALPSAPANSVTFVILGYAP